MRAMCNILGRILFMCLIYDREKTAEAKGEGELTLYKVYIRCPSDPQRPMPDAYLRSPYFPKRAAGQINRGGMLFADISVLASLVGASDDGDGHFQFDELDILHGLQVNVSGFHCFTSEEAAWQFTTCLDSNSISFALTQMKSKRYKVVRVTARREDVLAAGETPVVSEHRSGCATKYNLNTVVVSKMVIDQGDFESAVAYD